jgi:hypothetical protein
MSAEFTVLEPLGVFSLAVWLPTAPFVEVKFKMEGKAWGSDPAVPG